jgi:hypothetical protein
MNQWQAVLSNPKHPAANSQQLPLAMSMPALTDWGQTARSLHEAAQLLGLVRVSQVPPVPNYLELALTVTPDGLSTGRLPAGDAVYLDFGAGRLVYHTADGRETALPLAPHTQPSLWQALVAAMPGTETPGAVVETVRRRGYPVPERLLYPQDTPVLAVDPAQGHAYAAVLDTVFTGMARFRARLNGPLTPLVVWPEHFDLSMLWFADGDLDEHKPHLNFGFAPYSPGLERPYLYAYAYPYPPNPVFPALPTPARWHYEGWTGVVVEYDAFAGAANPVGFIETLCLDLFERLQPLLASGEKHGG